MLIIRSVLFFVLILTNSFCYAKNVCVFCSSKDSINHAYKATAFELGNELAKNNIGLVTGGRNTGLVNEIINGHASVKSNAQQYAIIPKSLQ